MESRPLADLTTALRARVELWVRIAAVCPVDSWRLAVLEITAGTPPPSWRPDRWLYERASFVASTVSGDSVAGWFDQRRVELDSLSLEVPDLPDAVQVERRQSGFGGIWEPLSWPNVVWSMRLGEQFTGQLPGELVAEGLRPFLSFDQAAGVFLGVAMSPSRGFGGREIVFRDQDLRGRIGAVRVRPTELIVEVEGDALEGASVGVGGDWAVPSARLAAETRRVRLPLVEPLPSRAWLALHLDRELLDHRYLGDAWGQADVEVEGDRRTQLAVLIAGGEGARAEFKRELPGADPTGAMKTVAAFANGDGGAIVFGVDDEGTVVGLDGGGARKGADRLANLVRDYVRPLPPYEIDVLDTDGTVLLLTVSAGPDAPYGVGTSDRNVVYYVRRGGTTFPATPGEVRAAVRAREAVRDPIVRRP
jgi:Putative DNA-binding domain